MKINEVIGIEPKTSWIYERVRRNIKEKNKMRWVGIEPTNSWKKLREKLREREWVCGGLIPQSLCLNREREEAKERKYYGGNGDWPRVPGIRKMQVPSLI